MSVTVKLAKKGWLIEEPVFKNLKQILIIYNALATCTNNHEQTRYLQELLVLFFGKKTPALRAISVEEWQAFLMAIPQACGLEIVKSDSKKDEPADWGYLYSHLCNSINWSWDYIDNNMTMTRLKEFQRYWNAHPPTHLLVAAFMGYERQEQKTVSAMFNRIKNKLGVH